MVKVFFIQLNAPPSSYKGIQKFLKEVLLTIHGSSFPSHFKNLTRSEVMRQFVTSTFVSKMYDYTSCLLCFQ